MRQRLGASWMLVLAACSAEPDTSGSVGGTTSPTAGAGTYLATKAAGEHLAFALARELGGRGVTVNVVSPGVTQTDGLVMPKPAIDHLVGLTPLGRRRVVGSRVTTCA